jgi:hypothetical protein
MAQKAVIQRLSRARPAKNPSIHDILLIGKMPNKKTDTNNRGPFSTDNIGMNYNYRRPHTKNAGRSSRFIVR